MEASLLLFKKTEDYTYFGRLLNEKDEKQLSLDEQKKRDIMKLLFLVKNGTPAQSETALTELTDKAQGFGAGPVFLCFLPLLMLMNPTTLEDQERHLLMRVLNGLMNKLGERVWPFTHKILDLIEPLLIDENDNARLEGREVIANLSKAVGLDKMIAAMLPDIDCVDEDVRKMTAIAFSVVASVLGISAVLPFLKTVCQSKSSCEARQTGMKIVREIAILMGAAVTPHLRSLVEIIGHGLNDKNEEVRSIADLSLDALVEAAGQDGVKIVMEMRRGERAQML